MTTTEDVAKIDDVALGAPSSAAVVLRPLERWNAWAWVGLVASMAILVYRWRTGYSGVLVDTDHLFSTRALLHATNRTVTVSWIGDWAELLAPIAFITALVIRSVVAARLAAAITAQAALMVVYLAVQRYVLPPWLEWWFYGAILVMVVASVVVLRVDRVVGPGGSLHAPSRRRVGARSTAIFSVLCGAVLLFLPALLLGQVARSNADEDDATSRRLAAVGTALGAIGLVVALGYLVATTQQTD